MRHSTSGFVTGSLAATLIAATAIAAEVPPTNPIRQTELMDHIKVLSSEAFEGHGDGSEMLLFYPTSEFRKLQDARLQVKAK